MSADQFDTKRRSHVYLVHKDGVTDVCHHEQIKGEADENIHSHIIGMKGSNGIVLKFSNSWLINHLEFTLPDVGTFSSFVVEGSMEDIKENWFTLCDFSQVKRHGQQKIFFNSNVIRLLKIKGTWKSDSRLFKITGLKVFHTKLDKSKLTFVENKWVPSMGDVVPLQVDSNGVVEVDGSAGFAYSVRRPADDIFEVNFCQPVCISRFSLTCSSPSSTEKFSFNGYISVCDITGKEEIVKDDPTKTKELTRSHVFELGGSRRVLSIRLVGLNLNRESELNGLVKS